MWPSAVAVLIVIIIALFVILAQQGNSSINLSASNRLFTGTETHAVVLMNDDVSAMETVVDTLVNIFGISQKRAVDLMLRVHGDGIAIAWTGGSNAADKHVQALKAAGLRCFMIEIER